MSLSIIIVNYKATHFIIDALTSFLPDPDFNPEVIVVDNGSGAEAIALLQSRFPFARILDMGYNAGFARANNAGIRVSTGDTVLLLNPDILDPQKSIRQCYERFVEDDGVAASVQLQNGDGTPQITGNFFMRGGLNHLLPLPVLGSLLRRVAMAAGLRKTNLPDSHTRETVDWINGAFMMVRKTAIAKAGLLDESFFLYAEEIEWCYRLGKIGKLYLYGDLKLIHLQGETANQSFGSSGKGYYNIYDKKGLQLMVSNHVRIRKQYGAGWFMVHMLSYGAELPLLFTWSLLGLLPGITTFPFTRWWGFFRNYCRLLMLSPKILLNRPHFYKML